jgi:diguanylate cyclase (GGDEF)-like protein
MSLRKPPGDTKELPGDVLEFLDEDTASLPGVRRPGIRQAAPRGNAHVVLMFGASVGKVFRLVEKQTIVGRDTGADIRLTDRAVSRHHLVIARDDRGWTAEDMGSRNGSYIGDRRLIDAVRLEHNDLIQLGANSALKFIDPAGPDAEHTLALYNAATTDFLTGVYNRRYLEEMLVSELSFARRHGQPMSLMLMDLDHFKEVNDSHGHQTGDEVLREFAELVKRSIRTEDHLGRYGGEEFAVIARATDVGRAIHKAERIRAMVERHPFSEGLLQLTVSIGVSGFAAGAASQTPKALLADADTGLYQAKESGRNRVVPVFGLDPTPAR